MVGIEFIEEPVKSSSLRLTGGPWASEILERNVFMPNPKRRHSKARTARRRAHDSLRARSFSECPNCHEQRLPHRACPKCGYYNGREVMEVESE